MWEDIELTSNIKSYQVVIAQHETRRTFAPILPTLRGGLGDHHVIVMPGNHSGIVEPMGRFDEPSAIVGDLAKRFLRSGKYRRFGDSKKEPQGGTKFLDSSLFGRAETLQLYTKIRQNFGEIRDEAKSSYGSQFSAKRAIRAQNSAGTAHATVPKLSRKLVRYFVNTHHEDVMSSYLPIICQTIKSNAVYEMLRRMTQADFQNDVRKLTLDPSMRGVLSDIHAHFYEMTGCDILP